MEDRATRLVRQVRLFVEMVRNAPREKLKLTEGGKWGVKEILIQLVFWQREYIRIIRCLLENKTPELLNGTLKSINAESIREYGFYPTEVLSLKLEESTEELARLAQREETTRLKFSFREGSKEWSFPDFLRVITEQVRKQRLSVKRLIQG